MISNSKLHAVTYLFSPRPHKNATASLVDRIILGFKEEQLLSIFQLQFYLHPQFAKDSPENCFIPQNQHLFGFLHMLVAIFRKAQTGILQRHLTFQLKLGFQMEYIIVYPWLTLDQEFILFNRNASSGGLDIVAKIMNKYLHMDLGKAMSLSGMCVALSAALVYDKKTVISWPFQHTVL